MRVFAAIELPDHVKSRIFHKFETLQGKNLFKGAFVKKDNLHITLKFFGEVSEEKADEIIKKLKEIKLRRFKCKTKGIGFFNNEKYIGVLWVAVGSDSEKLDELQKQIAGKFQENPSDSEKFNSHITVARVKNFANKANKERLLEEIKKIHLSDMEFDINEFVLMKSELMGQRKEGVRYKVLERFKLE